MDKIIELEINNFEKCNNIWNMDKNIDHKNKIYNDLVSGNRKTFVYVNRNDLDFCTNKCLSLREYINLKNKEK